MVRIDAEFLTDGFDQCDDEYKAPQLTAMSNGFLVDRKLLVQIRTSQTH